LDENGEHTWVDESEWYTNNGNNPAETWISFDLGTSVVLDSIHVWNTDLFSDFGIATLDIYVSDLATPGDPEGAGSGDWTQIGTNVSFAAAGSPNIGFDLETQTGILLPNTAVRHVRFEVNTAINSNNYVGLAEVQFFAAGTSGGDSFSNWIDGFTGLNGLTALGDDPDGDGNVNGIENYFGTHPGEFSQGLVSGTVTGSTMTFTHPLNNAPAPNLTANYRWSKDLSSFHGDGDSFEGTTVSFSQGTPNDEGIVTVTATITGGAPDRLFVDIEVSEN
jgi:hypothetical protein